MVANVDASDSRCRCIGMIITRDLRLVASRLCRMAVTRPRVTCRRYSGVQELLKMDIPMALFCASNAAIDEAYNPKLNDRSNHINVAYHFT